MTDRELLEFAAKAADMETMWDQPRGARNGHVRARFPGECSFPIWNPLQNNGEAFCLAVRLNLRLDTIDECACACYFTDDEPFGVDFVEKHKDGDRYASMRRAIVRAAAEIGRTA